MCCNLAGSDGGAGVGEEDLAGVGTKKDGIWGGFWNGVGTGGGRGPEKIVGG
jgi:hypothetical protein